MDMRFDEYQIAAERAVCYPGHMSLAGLSYAVHGLSGEAGEVANKFKKIYRDHNGVLLPLYKVDLTQELGDVLWYCAALASELNMNLSDIAAANLEKLRQRQERGSLGGSGDQR